MRRCMCCRRYLGVKSYTHAHSHTTHTHTHTHTAVQNKTAFIAFVSGLDLSPSGDVLITYGSADINSRLLSLPLPELEGLFSGNVAFRHVDVMPHEPVAADQKAARRLLGQHDGPRIPRRLAAAGGRGGHDHLQQRGGGGGLGEDGEEEADVRF
jgi:hypothetical protein